MDPWIAPIIHLYDARVSLPALLCLSVDARAHLLRRRVGLMIYASMKRERLWPLFTWKKGQIMCLWTTLSTAPCNSFKLRFLSSVVLRGCMSRITFSGDKVIMNRTLPVSPDSTCKKYTTYTCYYSSQTCDVVFLTLMKRWSNDSCNVERTWLYVAAYTAKTLPDINEVDVLGALCTIAYCEKGRPPFNDSIS